jgi:hypothetical protein
LPNWSNVVTNGGQRAALGAGPAAGEGGRGLGCSRVAGWLTPEGSKRGRGDVVLEHGQHTAADTFAEEAPFSPAPDGEGVRARRWLVDNLAGRLDELAKEMAGAYAALALRGGRHGTLSGSRAAEAATEQLLYLLRAAAVADSRGAEQGAELEALAALTVDLARAGCTLGDVLDVCHASFLVAWEAVGEELGELPAAVAGAIGAEVRRALLEAMTRSAVVVNEAFHEASAGAGCLPGALLGAVLDGGDRLAAAVARARAGRWPVSDPHSVVVVALEPLPGCGATGTAVAHLLVQAWAGPSAGGRPPLSCVRDDVVVLAVPEQSAAAPRWREVVALVSPPSGYRLLAGACPSEQGLAGVPAAYRGAMQALAAGRSRGGDKIVVGFEDVLPELLLRGQPELARRLYQRAVQPVEEGCGDTEALLASLEAYLDLGLNVVAASAAVGIHRHTLTARLRHVARCTGLRVEDGDDRLLLELGLRARRVLRTDGLSG